MQKRIHQSLMNLELLLVLVKDYEDKHVKLPAADPIEKGFMMICVGKIAVGL